MNKLEEIEHRVWEVFSDCYELPIKEVAKLYASLKSYDDTEKAIKYSIKNNVSIYEAFNYIIGEKQERCQVAPINVNLMNKKGLND